VSEIAGEGMEPGSKRRAPSYGAIAVLVQIAALAACLWAGPAFARTLKLVALGDSLTAGFGLKAADSFPAQLQRALVADGFDVAVVNAGVSGDTAEDGLARYDWSVPGDADALIVELGANDMLRGMPVEGMKAALAEILAKAKAARLPVLIAGMKAPRNAGETYRAAFEAAYADLAHVSGAALYPFFLDGVAGDASLNQSDGLHPTAAGVAIIVKAMTPAVEGLLRSAESK
jgi:acyl-CoA thioesterase I